MLVLELNDRGILQEKTFLNKEDMKNLKFSKSFTEMSTSKKSFVYDFLRTIRQKANDPLGKKRKRKN